MDEALLVNVTRVLPVPRDDVFRAWTTPEEIKRWFATPPGYTIPKVEVDLKPGGSYEIHMESPDGDIDRITGEYRSVVVPERLVYSWHWAESDDEPTEVTVVFKDLGPETEVVITHGSFATGELRDQHAGGWDRCLGGLQELLVGGGRAS